MTVKIATAQYNISFLNDWAAYQLKTEQWVSEAAEQGAHILLFPEYASMELASLFAEEIYSSLSKQLVEMQALLTVYLEWWQSLARKYRCIIQTGSFPVKIDNGSFRNRAYLILADGRVDFQDKLMMTRFENEQWIIGKGESIRCFDTDHGKIAICICYDSEFPLLARQQVEAGANIILVPSCTDTLAGYHRVKIGCQARALENQCYVIQSVLVGEAPWSEAVDINIGAAGVYTPVDRGFPDNGILSIGELNKVQWVFADITPARCDSVREQGQVLNYRDWSLQKTFISNDHA